ncbi:MAG: carbohydrate kinase family protein [Pirellulales bacterium]|nr:carbohydrate kinase family protein [Pirellulales bacterium]
MAHDCLSVGILVADHLCTPIPELPAPGQLVLADALPLDIGGCAANTAIDLARVGVEVGIVGCVGQDIMGTFMLDKLYACGVDIESVHRVAERHTSATLIINVAGEDRRFIHTLGANAVLRASDIPMHRVQRTKVLYVGGYLLMSALDPYELADVFRAARAAGVRTVLDVVLPDHHDAWPLLEPVLPQTDVFLPNEDEAVALTKLSDPLAQAERFVAAGARTAVITCGGRGTYLVNDQVRLRAGVYPTEFVGGTGAGDAFDAGYIVGLLRGGDPQLCLQWGSALGASCVRAVSATQSVFTRADAEAFVAAHKLVIDRL